MTVTGTVRQLMAASRGRRRDRSNEKTRQMYGGKSDIKNYESCFRCGGPHKDFRPTQPGDCPDGCTLNPIIQE